MPLAKKCIFFKNHFFVMQFIQILKFIFKLKPHLSENQNF